MQTWYGEYYIPADLFIIDLNKHPEFEDPNYDLYKYMTTANGGLGITEDDPVFEKEGYLIINFEIKAGAVVTKADGTKSFAPYLKYYSDKKEANMWKIEGYNNAPLAGDPTPITSFKDGDVVVVDLGKSVKDKYSSGVHNVN
jgi:hypothetical protein